MKHAKSKQKGSCLRANENFGTEFLVLQERSQKTLVLSLHKRQC